MKMGNADQIDETPEIIQQMQVDCDGFEMSDLVHCLKLFNEAANGQSTSWQPGLALELAFSQTLLTTTSSPVLSLAPVRQPVKTAQTVQKTEQPPTLKPKVETTPPVKQQVVESVPQPVEQPQNTIEIPPPHG